jgi:hypothetical protein
MGWAYECGEVLSGCHWRSESVGFRERAKRLDLIHLKNEQRISLGQNWERLVGGAIR